MDEVRFDHCLPYFGNGSYDIVLNVQLPPASIERIIITVQNSETSSKRDDENTSSFSFADSRLIDTSHERTEMYAKLKSWAEYEAETRFHQDHQSVCERGVEWPLEEALKRAALIKSDVAIREYIRPDLDRENARDFFVDNYMHKYREKYEEITGDSALNNGELAQLKRTAKLAAINDREDGIKLEEVEFNYQAAIHIQHFLGGTTRASGGYLERIVEYIPHYKSAYREEMDRAQRSAPFPGEWQSGRYSQP